MKRHTHRASIWRHVEGGGGGVESVNTCVCHGNVCVEDIICSSVYCELYSQPAHTSAAAVWRGCRVALQV